MGITDNEGLAPTDLLWYAPWCPPDCLGCAASVAPPLVFEVDEIEKEFDKLVDRAGQPSAKERISNLLDAFKGLKETRDAERAAGKLPYPWCIGAPTRDDCIQAGYCRRNPNCGE